MSQNCCTICRLPVSKTNMSRHLRQDHPDRANNLVRAYRCRQTNDFVATTSASSSDTSVERTSVSSLVSTISKSTTTLSTSISTMMHMPLLSTAVTTNKPSSTSKTASNVKSLESPFPSTVSSSRTTHAATLSVSAPSSTDVSRTSLSTKDSNFDAALWPSKLPTTSNRKKTSSNAVSATASISSPSFIINTQPDVSSSTRKISQSSAGEMTSTLPVTPNERVAETATTESPMTRFLHGTLQSATVSMISVAVQDVIESHDRYDAPSLTSLIAERYPGIPGEVAPYIVIAATSAAKHVAHLHLLREMYRNAENPQLRRQSENVCTSMLSWSFGLRRDDQQCPAPVSAQGDQNPTTTPVASVIDVTKLVSPAPTSITLPQGTRNQTTIEIPVVSPHSEPSTSTSVQNAATATSLDDLRLPVDPLYSMRSFDEFSCHMDPGRTWNAEPRVVINLEERNLAKSKLLPTNKKSETIVNVEHRKIKDPEKPKDRQVVTVKIREAEKSRACVREQEEARHKEAHEEARHKEVQVQEARARELEEQEEARRKEVQEQEARARELEEQEEAYRKKTHEEACRKEVQVQEARARELEEQEETRRKEEQEEARLKEAQAQEAYVREIEEQKEDQANQTEEHEACTGEPKKPEETQPGEVSVQTTQKGPCSNLEETSISCDPTQGTQDDERKRTEGVRRHHARSTNEGESEETRCGAGTKSEETNRQTTQQARDTRIVVTQSNYRKNADPDSTQHNQKHREVYGDRESERTHRYSNDAHSCEDPMDLVAPREFDHTGRSPSPKRRRASSRSSERRPSSLAEIDVSQGNTRHESKLSSTERGSQTPRKKEFQNIVSQRPCEFSPLRESSAHSGVRGFRQPASSSWRSQRRSPRERSQQTKPHEREYQSRHFGPRYSRQSSRPTFTMTPWRMRQLLEIEEKYQQLKDQKDRSKERR